MPEEILVYMSKRLNKEDAEKAFSAGKDMKVTAILPHKEVAGIEQIYTMTIRSNRYTIPAGLHRNMMGSFRGWLQSQGVGRTEVSSSARVEWHFASIN